MRLAFLLGDSVLVHLDPVKEVQGSIIVPDTVVRPIRTGVVKMAGPGKRYKDRFVATEVREGDHVAFFIGAADTKSGQLVNAQLNEDERLLTERDILFAFDGDLEVSL
jgi:co-chaperonin GroES (HSP10)